MIAVAFQRAGQSPERTAHIAFLLVPVATADLPPPSILYHSYSIINKLSFCTPVIVLLQPSVAGR